MLYTSENLMRASIFDFTALAEQDDDIATNTRYLENGFSTLSDEKVAAQESWEIDEGSVYAAQVTDLHGKLIGPGFVVTHITGKWSVFACCLHLEDRERECLHDTDLSVALCTATNLFLGSDLFIIKRDWQPSVRMGSVKDVGADTTFNMLQTLGRNCKAGQLQQYRLRVCEACCHATLASAQGLELDDKIGHFISCKKADFGGLDPAVSPLQKSRRANSKDIWKRLCAMKVPGDDHHIAPTLLSGKPVWQRSSEELAV